MAMIRVAADPPRAAPAADEAGEEELEEEGPLPEREASAAEATACMPTRKTAWKAPMTSSSLRAPPVVG